MGYASIKDKFNRGLIGQHHPGNVSMDSNQAGATMASRYTTAKYAAIVGAGAFPVGALARGGSAITGSKAYKAYGAFKRPILSLGVHQQIRGATAAMSLSKAYSKMAITGGVLNFGRNIQLARAKEYKRLGINVMGPPLSLFMYDQYMAHDTNAEAEIAEVKQEESRVDPSLTSGSRTLGNPLPNVSGKRYHLGRTRNWAKGHNPCATGYKLERRSGIYYCVKR